MRPALIFAILCAAWAICPGDAFAQAARDLKCENEANPTAVTSPHPEFSWIGNPNQEQKAYQVLVATSPEKLTVADADLWDSGRIVSGEKKARYHGKPLGSMQHYYWRVRLWGNYYQPTNFSPPASFQTGQLPAPAAPHK